MTAQSRERTISSTAKRKSAGKDVMAENPSKVHARKKKPRWITRLFRTANDQELADLAAAWVSVSDVVGADPLVVVVTPPPAELME